MTKSFKSPKIQSFTFIIQPKRRQRISRGTVPCNSTWLRTVLKLQPTLMVYWCNWLPNRRALWKNYNAVITQLTLEVCEKAGKTRCLLGKIYALQRGTVDMFYHSYSPAQLGLPSNYTLNDFCCLLTQTFKSPVGPNTVIAGIIVQTTSTTTSILSDVTPNQRIVYS